MKRGITNHHQSLPSNTLTSSSNSKSDNLINLPSFKLFSQRSKKHKLHKNLELIAIACAEIRNMKNDVFVKGKNEILLKNRLYLVSDQSLDLVVLSSLSSSSSNNVGIRRNEGDDDDDKDRFNRVHYIYKKAVKERMSEKWNLDYVIQNQKLFKSGDSKVKVMKYILDNIPNPHNEDLKCYTRFSHQVDFHDAIIQSALPILYGQQWDNNSDLIMKRFNMEKHFVETIICSARRVGKTIAIVMIAVAFLLACPNIKIGIFSTCRNTSNLLREEVIRILQIMVPNYISKNNMELTILEMGPNDQRLIATNTSVVKVRQ